MSEHAGPDEMRIGTQEREDAVRVLGEHHAAGRLTAEEYEQRAATAREATTRGAVRPLFADLPGAKPPFLAPEPPGPPPPPGFPMAPAPYGPGPVAEYSDRSRTVAGVLQIVLPFGVGRFYTGQAGLAVAQLMVTFFTFGIGAIWPFIDGIVLLVSGGVDGYGRPLRD